MKASSTQSNNERGMSASSAAVVSAWFVNAPLGLILIILMSQERALLILSFTVTVTFWITFIKQVKHLNGNWRYTIKEALFAHFAGLFIGVPTWSEIGLIYALITQ